MCPSVIMAAVTPLSAIADAFEGLAKFVKINDDNNNNNGSTEEEQQELRTDAFCDACSHVSVLLHSLGFVFRFAELEYISKLNLLMEASKTHETLQDIIDFDVANETVKANGSLSRCLRRVRQGLDLVRAIFKQFLLTGESSLKEAASTAYAEVCAPYHSWTIRTAVAAGMYALPTREQLLVRLNETGLEKDTVYVPTEFLSQKDLNLNIIVIADQSAEKKMIRYINASDPIIEYIDKLYVAQNIGLDW